MSYKTMEYRPAKRDRAMKPVLAALAVLATVATMGLTVAGPAAVARNAAEATLAARTAPAPTVIAILPAIEVVGKRTRTARAESPFVPTTYRQR